MARSQSRSTFPCPNCRRMITVGDTYCGFCREALFVECPVCGQWTKAKHAHCPGCGSFLRGGYSFQQRQQRIALQEQRKAIQAELRLSQQRLAELYARRRRAYLRVALVIGLLLCAAVMVINLFEGMTSTTVGVIVLIALVWIFRFTIPGLTSALWHLCSLAFPEIRPLQQAIAEEERSLRDLEQDAHEVTRKRAVLKQQAANPQQTTTPSLHTHDEEDEDEEA